MDLRAIATLGVAKAAASEQPLMLALLGYVDEAPAEVVSQHVHFTLTPSASRFSLDASAARFRLQPSASRFEVTPHAHG